MSLNILTVMTLVSTLFSSKANMDNVRKISLHSRVWIAALATVALGISAWSIAPAPANAGVVIPIPGLYAHTCITPIRRPTIRIIRHRRQCTHQPPAIHLNRVIRLGRASRAATSPDN
jgi:hypothetical protein